MEKECDIMLEIENVFLTLGHKQVLRGLNLSLGESKIYGLLGRNGAGKSTIGFLLMGLDRYKPDKGRIILNGEDITGLNIEKRAKKGITLAWQEPARFEGISIKDFLTLGGKYNFEEAEKFLEYVGLLPEIYLSREIDNSLSGGERKRIELASIMMIKPKIAILDEPDSGIDFQSYEKIINVAKYLKDHGSTVIIISHSNNISGILDYAYLIYNGASYKEGDPEKVEEFYKKQCSNCNYFKEGSKEFEYQL
jgi:Fe-S cluster assembly ATP-binding protein